MIKTLSHQYFGPMFILHERKLPLVSWDIFIFFKSYWKGIKIEFEVEKTKFSRIWRFQKKKCFFQNSIKTSSHTYFLPIFFHKKGNYLWFHGIFLFFFQILLEEPQNLVWSWKMKLCSWTPILKHCGEDGCNVTENPKHKCFNNNYFSKKY